MRWPWCEGTGGARGEPFAPDAGNCVIPSRGDCGCNEVSECAFEIAIAIGDARIGRPVGNLLSRSLRLRPIPVGGTTRVMGNWPSGLPIRSREELERWELIGGGGLGRGTTTGSIGTFGSI